MENALPYFSTKKKTQNQEIKKYPIVPDKPAKYCKQSRESTYEECKDLFTDSLDDMQSNDQDIKLLSFTSLKTPFETTCFSDTSKINSCNNFSAENLKATLRKSSGKNRTNNKQFSCNNNLGKIDDGVNEDFLSISTHSGSTHITANDSPLKTLRETFDECKSLIGNDQLVELLNKKSDEEKFKRISELPKFLWLKIDEKVETNKEPSSSRIISNSPVNATNLHSKSSPGARSTMINLNEPSLKFFEDGSENLSSQCKELRSPNTPLLMNEDPFASYISEDCLSDDGDVVLNDDEELEFSRPSSDVMLQSIPIVPSKHSHHITERKGFLFKYTSGKTSRLTSKLVTSWQKRWVTFDSKFLIYYSSPKSIVSRRVLPVCNMLNVKQVIKHTEPHPYQFRIVMKHKMAISFASASSDDMSLWTSIIMKSILDASTNIEKIRPREIFQPPGIQGFAKLEGTRGKKYLACNHGQFIVYNTQSDFECQLPIFMLNMQLISVRDVNKLKLQINTPQSSHIFLFETQEETNLWKQALENGISCSLGDDEVMKKVYANQSNMLCADCRAEGPEWASINLGITLCQNCAGIHRKIVNAKIKSLRMDFRVWSESLVEMMKLIGNENSNKVWEHSLKHEDKINTISDMARRKQFIEDKYCDKMFFDNGKLEEIGSLQLLSTHQIIRLTFSGANVEQIIQMYEEHSSKTDSVEISAPLLEFLRQNITRIGA